MCTSHCFGGVLQWIEGCSYTYYLLNSPKEKKSGEDKLIGHDGHKFFKAKQSPENF
jgi:hypothetical protein